MPSAQTIFVIASVLQGIAALIFIVQWLNEKRRASRFGVIMGPYKHQIAFAILVIGSMATAVGAVWMSHHQPTAVAHQQPTPSIPQKETPKRTITATPIATKQPPHRLHPQHPLTVSGTVAQSGTGNQQTVIRTMTQSNSGGCNQQVASGNNNTNNCNIPPKITASAQTQGKTGKPNAPWATVFTIQTSTPTPAGDLRLKCSGPALKAGISQINPYFFAAGSNGPDPSDPNTVIYQLSPDTLVPGKIVTIVVYSMTPITVISGTIGTNTITFPQ